MSPISKTTFTDWHKEQMQDPNFVIALENLEPWYQKARRIQQNEILPPDQHLESELETTITFSQTLKGNSSYTNTEKLKAVLTAVV